MNSARSQACPRGSTRRSWVLAFAALFSTLYFASVAAGFARDEQGWTVLEPSGGSRVVYVSSSEGNDANDGLSPGAAVSSVSRGMQLIRDNSNDFLLFRKGDTWNEGFGTLFRGGISAERPLVFSSYGEGARPKFNTGNSSGAYLWSSGYANSHGGGYNNLVFHGLHFHADTYTGAQPGELPAGFRIDRAGQNLLFEDMYIEGYATNIVVQQIAGSMGRNIQVRRSVLVDAYALRDENGRPWDLPGRGTGTDRGYEGGGRSQGLYASNIDGLLIEENVLDHNGWRPGIEGAERTIYNHNLYIQRDVSPDVTVRGNIIANAAAHGAQLRNGGVLEDNLVIGNGTGMFIHQNESGALGRAERNVFLHSSNDVQYALGDVNHGDTGPRNWGLDLGNVSGSIANDNLILHTPNGRNPVTGLQGVSNEGNLVYEWGSVGLSYDAGVYTEPFPDPERTIATFDAAIGGSGSIESFLAGARQLSRDNWDPRYFATTAYQYFLDGFLERDVLIGDYNDDGVVDAIDYTAWRDAIGQIESLPNRDPRNFGVVGVSDFESWKNHFGEGQTLEGAKAQWTPEPATAGLALAAATVGGMVRRRLIAA